MVRNGGKQKDKTGQNKRLPLLPSFYLLPLAQSSSWPHLTTATSYACMPVSSLHFTRAAAGAGAGRELSILIHLSMSFAGRAVYCPKMATLQVCAFSLPLLLPNSNHNSDFPFIHLNQTSPLSKLLSNVSVWRMEGKYTLPFHILTWQYSLK